MRDNNESERAPSRPITGAVNGVALTAVDDTLRVRLVWLLVFRAVVVSVLLFTAVALRLTSEEQLFARAAVALYGAAGLAYATILLGAVWLRLTGKRHTIVIAYVQLIADAGIGTVLVAVTGGVESIFVFLYSLSVLNAAIVIARRGAIVIAAVSAVLYGLVLLVQALRGDQALLALLAPFLTNSASFFLVAVLGGYLTGQLTSTSERLQSAHAEIERLEQLYAAVLGSLPSGVMSVDPFGKVVYVNGAGVEILGSKDLVGRSLKERADFLQDLVRDRHDRFEMEVPVPNRGTRFIGGSVAPLIGVQHAGSVVVFQDLTELRRLQAEVGRAERMAELGRLAAGLAHEVRNPLAAMIGCLELLNSDAPKLGEEGGRMLGIVHREAERLSTLVGEFLTYARPAPAKTDALNVGVFFGEILSMAKNGLRAVDVTADAAGGPLVACDGAQLKQVLWNLVVNADAMVASQGRRGRVHLSLVGDGDFANICVDDDGPGVAADLRERIFEPFFTTRPDGNGLGLATCAQLMRQNAGQIRVEPSALGGARFVVRLPVKRVPIGTVV